MKGRVVEIFSSFQGEGLIAGKRQIFIRFTGCNLNCNYCDTRYARAGGKWMDTDEVIDDVLRRVSNDLHSISFTGGEPLLQHRFVGEIAQRLKEYGFLTYLETNGTFPTRLQEVAGVFDFAAIDIKLPSHFQDMTIERYEQILNRELCSILVSYDEGIMTFVKMVISRNTTYVEVEEVCQELKDEVDGRVIPVILQPCTAINGVNEPTFEQLVKMSEIASSYIRSVYVLPQIHRCMGWR
ncbi:MAG: 7-carboxy-7-deazaguanine synthase QueE [Candidatus Altiarchaeales archaeon]|nr:MAG: 7-carboxy-7-deazaguanine synthase QueE [Candidatus Altiarchaeales archaeon]